MSSVTKEAGVGFQTAWLGSVGYVAEINDKRERLIWLDVRVVDRLKLRFLGQLMEPHIVAQQDPDDECDDHGHDEDLLLGHENLLPNVD